MVVVYYNIHTTGLRPHEDEILNLGAVSDCGGWEFEAFVRPQGPVPQPVTLYTGLAADCHGQLYRNGTPVRTVCLTRAVHEFADFLWEVDEDADDAMTLVAHNGRSFQQHFLRAGFERSRALGRLLGLQAGFDDSRPALQRALPAGSSLQLRDLARDYLGLAVVHDALEDAKALRLLSQRFRLRFTPHDL